MKHRRRDTVTSYRMTRSGKHFILALIVAILPAYLLSVSMMFLMSTLFCGMFVFNFLYIRNTLKGLVLSLAQAPDFYAGQPGVVLVNVKNKKRFFRTRFLSLSLEIPGFSAEKARLEYIKPSGRKQVKIVVTPENRGWFHISAIVCETTGPFGLSKRSVRWRVDHDLLAYPQLLDHLPGSLSSQNMDFGRVPQNSGDYQYLAAYQPGDDVRLIHWKKSTLLETPVLKKDLIRSETVEPKIFVPDQCPHFEYAVSAIATYFQGNPLAGWSLYTDDGVLTVDNLDGMLKALALVKPLTRAPEIEELEQLGSLPLFASQINRE